MGEVGAYPCHGQHGTQEFLLDVDGQVRVALMDFTSCLGSKVDSEWPVVVRCAYEGAILRAGFEWSETSGTLKSRANGRCLTASTKERDGSPVSVRYDLCVAGSTGQEWRFE